MRINWSDPSKNTQADVDALRQWIHDTDPAKDHSDLYRPVAKRSVTPAATARR